MKSRIQSIGLIVLLAAAPILLHAAPERVSILDPVIGQSDKAGEAMLRKALADAAALTGILHGESLAVLPADSPDRAEYRLKTIAVLNGADSTIVLSLIRAADEEERGPVTVMGEIRQDTAESIAQGLFALWSAFHGYLEGGMEDPPAFLDALATDTLAESLLAGRGMPLSPMSLAIRGDGHLVAGMVTLAVEFDGNLRVVAQPGKSLLDEGNYSYATGVAVTPANTLYCKPSLGRDLYRFPDGATEPQRVRLAGIDLTSQFTVLADGSMVFLDMQKKRAIRISGKTQGELALYRSPYSWIGLIAAGPDATLWAYDVTERRIRIYTAEGKQVGSVMPVLDPAHPLSPNSLSVRADGSFLISCTSTGLWCFRPNGEPWWNLADLDPALGGPLPRISVVAADSASGLVFLTDYMGRRLLRLLDASYCRGHGIGHAMEDRILEQNAALSRDPDDPAPYRKKAALYEEIGSLELARGAWEECLQINPSDAEAKAHLAALEASSLRIQADDMAQRTLGLLESLGPESAKASYSQAIQLYERVLRLAPRDAAARERMEDLQRRMGQGAPRPSGPPPLTIAEARVDPLFPALLRHYAEHPAGSLTVENATGEEAKDVRASLHIQKFMDFPAETEGIPSLEPGGRVEIPIRILLNDGVLDVQEDLTVQARIVLSWKSGGERRSEARTVNTVLYRRTALSWDSSGKLASFITPNEESVSSFSLKAAAPSQLTAQWRFTDKFLRAQGIADALGAYGITYVEDPESPISRTLGREEAIDTVRFPRTTLLTRAGDCDDTTALLASLLEAAGIHTAILTTPGHVFLAFDSEEPEENASMLSSPALETVRRDGSLWIPIESTALKKGFHAAWKAASDLVRQYADTGSMEFLPTISQWETYPPLPLSRSTIPIVEPRREDVDALTEISARDLTDALYGARIAEMVKQRTAATGRQALRIRTQEGVLHARFGRVEEAERAFRSCLQEDPEYTSAYINLANLRISGNDVDGAMDIIEKGLARNDESAVLWLLHARCAQAKGDSTGAGDGYAKVASISPPLGARYASEFAAASTGAVAADTASRASGNPLKNKTFWVDGE